MDVRVLAATNRNLAAEVAQGNFRQDLYFRVETAHVYVPPLRDRMEDLPLLVEHFLSRSKPPRRFGDVPEAVWGLFNSHRWPGNVRELSNAVQRLLVTPERALGPASDAGRVVMPPAGVPVVPNSISPLRIARREASDAFERGYLETLLGRTEGNITRAAAIAEASRQMLQKLMRKHAL